MTTDEQTVTAASELAERLVDEVSRAKQDWPLIARLAGVLAELARQAAARSTSYRARPSGH